MWWLTACWVSPMEPIPHAIQIDPEAINQPNAVAIDKSVSPNRLYVTDTGNNRVLGYSSISALLNGYPATLVIGQTDLFSGGGNSTSATSLSGPKAVAVDKLGNLYIADTGNNRVLEYITPFASGKTAGVAASMVFGQGLDFTSSQCNFGLTAIPDIESMCSPSGVALDSSGNLFVADTNNNRVLVYKVPFNPATDANIVFGQNGSFTSNLANLGRATPSAKGLWDPAGLAVDTANNLYVADANNNRVLKFTTPLTNTTANLVFGQLGLFVLNACNEGGTPGSGTLCDPMGVTVDALGDVLIADTSNNRVLMFKPPIAINPIANFVFGQGGSFSSTSCNGGYGIPPSNATLCGPHGVAPDSANANLFIADTSNNRVLRWPYSATAGPAAVANVVVGQPDFTHNSSNTVDATGLCNPSAAAIDKSVTPNRLWVVDTNNNRVLGYASAATFATYSAATIVIGQADFYSGSCNQGIGVSSKTLCAPNAAAVDATGNLYVADGNNNRVLEYINPFLSGTKANQAAAVVFGQGGIFTTNASVCPPPDTCPFPPPAAGTATAGSMCLPSGVAIDQRTGNGSLYVSDSENSRVLRFKPPFGTNPVPTLVLGQSTFTANYPNRNATCSYIFPAANSLSRPDQIATDTLGNVYVGDTENNRVLEYTTPSVNGVSANKVFGQLGNFTAEDCNLDSVTPDLDADSLCGADGMAADGSATPSLYIADTNNNRILWYSVPLTSGTTADLVIGQASYFTNSCNFGGSAPSLKSLCRPLTPAVDSVGNLYVPDAGNNRVLEYDNPDPPPPGPTPKPTATRTPTPKPKPTPTPKPTAALIKTGVEPVS